MSVRLDGWANKFVVEQEDAGAERKLIGKNITYEDLLMWQGQHLKDYYDLTAAGEFKMIPAVGKTLSSFETPFTDSHMGRTIRIKGKNWVRWRQYGDPDIRMMSAGNHNRESDCGLGMNNEQFIVAVDCEGLSPGDVIAPVKNKRCGVVVQDEGALIDGVWQYEVVNWTESEIEVFEPDYLEDGEYWIKLGSISSWEQLGQAGSFTHRDNFSYVEYEVPLTTQSHEYTVDGEVHRRWGTIKINRCDDDIRGNTSVRGKLTNFLDLKHDRMRRTEKELLLTWGTKTEHMIDVVSNMQITTSPGYFEYMEMGNCIPYCPDVDGLDFIFDRLDQLAYDRIPISQRVWVLETGQAGMRLFSDWVLSRFNQTAVMFHHDMVLDRRTPFDPRKGRKGFAFTQPHFVEYQLPGYGVIKTKLLKSLDNTRINGVLYPGKHFPVSSLEFIVHGTILGKENNVRMIERVDNKIDTYICGLWSPLGMVGPKNPIWKNPSNINGELADCYMRKTRESFGLVFENPHLTLRFKPNISY